MDVPVLPSPRLARKASSIPAALTSVLKTLGLEEEDPEEVFEIHSKEGAGAFGRVFRASYRHEPAKLAALKVIPVALEAGQRGEDIENVRREIQFLRECDHPNVVAFFGAYYKDSALWVAMEYCGGGSVGDVSRRRRLEEREVAVITRGALHGLAYLHARKKIHRDIKGGNILLTSRGEVKIADFGVSAQLKDTLSRRGTFVGTPYWMSPEMIQDSDYDYKSDIWSLGITMIELADQKPPLFDEHPMRVLIQIPRNPPPAVKNPLAWTPLFSQFLQFCLRKDPKERPSAVECLDHEFIRGVDSVPFVYAESAEARLLAENTAREEADAASSSGASSSVPSVASFSVESSSRRGKEDSEAMADDVTLKASAARPPRPSFSARADAAGVTENITSPSPPQALELRSLRRESVELEEKSGMSESPGTPRADASANEYSGGGDGVGTPRNSESAVEEVWDLSRSAVVTSSRSSRCSDDDTSEDNDASAEGFAFRQRPSLSSSSDVSPATAAAAVASAQLPPTRLELVSGDDLLQLSVDDSFEMPAMALISKFHAAASTLAGHQSLRHHSAAAPPPVQAAASPLPVSLQSAPSPITRPAKRASINTGRLQPSSDFAAAAASARRNLDSFSRTDSIGRGSLHHGVVEASEDTSATTEAWSNPLAGLTGPASHDRVNALLSSISASSAHLLLPQQQQLASSMEFNPHASLRGSRATPSSSSVDLSGGVASASPSSSSNHFIGTPFRVSHQLCVKYNTLEAKFEGVPAANEWASVHRQFGIPLAQMRSRSHSSGHDLGAAPALLHMLRRELVRRGGLECKYIYRVSPDQSEIARAKQAINGGAFEPAAVSDPHVFASLIKHWLRELPVPLLAAIPRGELATAAAALVKRDDDAGDARADNRELEFAAAFADVHAYVAASLLGRLPAGERGVLLWLVDHMLEVVQRHSRNAMTAQSLAVVMAPNMYRWASTTPADASLISQQIATILQVLVAWRQRSQGGSARDAMAAGSLSSSAMASLSEGGARTATLRSRSSHQQDAAAFAGGVGSSVSLRGSLSGFRPSLDAGGASRDSTVTGLLRRSDVMPAAASSHFVSASPGGGVASLHHAHDAPLSPPPQQVSLEAALRDCVDALWNELPLSIMLDVKPPIVRSLHTKFQTSVLSLVEQHAKRDRERQWALRMLHRLSDPQKRLGHEEEDTATPLGVRHFKRWILAALHLEAFITLLRQERHARTQLEKRWTSQAKRGHEPAVAPELTSRQVFSMQHLLALAARGHAASTDDANDKIEDTQTAERGQVMLDGAATFLRLLHKVNIACGGAAMVSSLPLAEDIARMGEAEPALGHLLVGLSEHHTCRFHLPRQHTQIVAAVERFMIAGLGFRTDR